jgi:hypothetical protein
MSAKQIKDHFGAFVETARREPVVHTHHGREVLVTMSVEKAREHDILPSQTSVEPPVPVKRNALLDLIGVGRKYSIYKSGEDVDRAIRKMRDEGP